MTGQELSWPQNVLDAIKCGPVPNRRDWRNLPVGDLTRGEKVCRFIEEFLVVPEGDMVGQPIRLLPFQECFVLATYDNPAGTGRAYLSIARKNGKTGIIACLVLAHIVGPEALTNSRMMSGARSRKQAAEVYNYSSKMLMMSPRMKGLYRVVPSGKMIVGLRKNVEYQASSAEAKSAHGGSPIVAVLDELGQIKGPTDDFVEACVTSQGAYGDKAMVFGISTQAATDGDLFSRWLMTPRRQKRRARFPMSMRPTPIATFSTKMRGKRQTPHLESSNRCLLCAMRQSKRLVWPPKKPVFAGCT